MDSTKIWNRIVKHFKDNYSAKEEVIQKDWEQIFSDLFNYSRLFGEIDAHRNIHIGSHQRTIPDIIITSENGDLFDVELKQYNLPFSLDMENQLKSYMDLLHIAVGVIICQQIHLYVYNTGKTKLKKISIAFQENNPDGVKFVELMCKGSFSLEKVTQFIDSKNSFIENVARIKASITEELKRELLIEYFKKEYSEEEIHTALSELSAIDDTVQPFVAVEDEPKTSPQVAKTEVSEDDVYEEPSFDYVLIKTSYDRVNNRNGSLYEATRYAWRVGPRIESYAYVISVIDMVVQEVYTADSWNVVSQGDLQGRYEFHGKIATDTEARKLVGKRIPFKYRKPGAANPVMFKKKD